MAVDDILSPEMTGNNINKLMRTNLNLNSKILSKNTTEILNTCIGQLYKQMPLTFRRGLHQGRSVLRPLITENHAPIERFRMENRQRANNFKPFKANANSFEDRVLSTLMSMSQKPNAPLPKKATKPPAYKIYNRKRYCSSRSSSSGTMLCRHDDRNRLGRAYHTQTNFSTGKPSVHKSPVKPLKDFTATLPARNQHISTDVTSWRQALEVSSHIRKDLMSVDEEVKKRLKAITVTNTQTTKTKLCKPPLEFNFKTLKMSPANQSESKAKYLRRLLKLNDVNMDNNYATSDSQNLKSPKKLTGSRLIEPHISAAQTKNQSLENIKPKLRLLSAADHETDSNALGEQTKNASKRRRTTLRNCVPPEEAFIRKSEDENRFQANGKITPSATYCLANPWNINTMKYIM